MVKELNAGGMRPHANKRRRGLFPLAMSNHSSSSSGGGDHTIVLPRAKTTNGTRPGDHDSSSDDGGHHGNRTRAVAAPDNDGVEQTTLMGLLAGAGVIAVVVVAWWIVRRRRRKRPSLFAPTPSLILTLHTQMESPATTDAVGRPVAAKPRGSTTTTNVPDLSARCSSSMGAARRLSKGSSSGSTLVDGTLLTSACVDPVITAARIPLDAISLIEMVGRGAFGDVYRGTFDDHAVAVKRIVADRRRDLVYIEAFLGEAKFLTRLEHPYIVKFLGVAWDSLSDLCVVTEFMEGGDLRSLLHRFDRVDHRPKGFDAHKIHISLHVAHAIAYLHSLSPVVLHRDLKSRNVLLDKHHQIAKLTDFGIARERDDPTTSVAGVGSSLWMAPEVLVGDRYDEKADTFSFGILLSEIDTHLSPYTHVREPREGMRRIPDPMLLQMVATGKLQVEFSQQASGDTVSREMTALALQCIARDPKSRPTAAQIMHRIHLILRKVEK